jgi:hypothetical protein
VQGFQLITSQELFESVFLEHVVTNLWQDFQGKEESVSSNCHVWAEENSDGTRHQ